MTKNACPLLPGILEKQYQYILRNMGVWDKRFFREFFAYVLKKKTTIMRHLGDTYVRSRQRNTDRNISFLSKESFADLPRRIEKRCFSLVGEIQKDTPLCIDEVDINKEYAKKMEGLSTVRDGSTGKMVNGYLFHGASINGVPVILEQEDFGKTARGRVFYNLVDRIREFTGGKGVFLLDRLYDVRHYYKYLMKNACQFVVRLKKNRHLLNLETGKEFCVGDINRNSIIHVKLLNNKKQPIGEPLWMYVYWMRDKNGEKKYREPIRVLTNKQDIDAVSFYLRRWEIEQVFRVMKQSYDLEKIQTHSLQVIRNIVATIQLSVAIANAIYNRDSQFRMPKIFTDLKRFEKKFARWSKWMGLTMNRSSICTFIAHLIEKTYKYPKYPPHRVQRKYCNQNQENLAQLSFF